MLWRPRRNISASISSSPEGRIEFFSSFSFSILFSSKTVTGRKLDPLPPQKCPRLRRSQGWKKTPASKRKINKIKYWAWSRMKVLSRYREEPRHRWNGYVVQLIQKGGGGRMIQFWGRAEKGGGARVQDRRQVAGFGKGTRTYNGMLLGWISVWSSSREERAREWVCVQRRFRVRLMHDIAIYFHSIVHSGVMCEVCVYVCGWVKFILPVSTIIGYLLILSLIVGIIWLGTEHTAGYLEFKRTQCLLMNSKCVRTFATTY